ncbi:DUF3945 domain-containing protein [Labilibaculum sp. DW002]|uniref:DUF3945 domain-containing protein n=1 Tax=Paralabilibaculum antarcticum TaxID=2912572 RepID=A0ABT5VQ77_9BACT|nr:DUF3945 domain-containing protein [Labilibaculum sp. DW002]MDE5417589.1 DUF3945 domain-containing protein [Labilibaculum sp. DW002]
MEQTTRITKEEIPFEKLEKAGIKKDFVDRMESQELKDFLNGFRSAKLYTINAKINDEQYRIPTKIRLQKEEDGSVKVKVHPIQRLHIPDEYLGHKFTKEEKTALLEDKHLGKTIEMTNQKGEKDNYYLSLDAKTNELIPLRSKHINIPEKIKGASLSEEQKQQLAAGKKIHLDGMTGKNGKKFSASLQVDAANRSINFSGFKKEKEKEQEKEQKTEKKKGIKQKVG